jgi:hypothetical protein
LTVHVVTVVTLTVETEVERAIRTLVTEREKIS